MFTLFFWQGKRRHFKFQNNLWIFNGSIFQFCYFCALNQTASLISPVLGFPYTPANLKFLNWLYVLQS